MSREYFISYSHSSGFGNVRSTLSNGIKLPKCSQEVEKSIEEDFKLKGVVILWYKKSRKLGNKEHITSDYLGEDEE